MTKYKLVVLQFDYTIFMSNLVNWKCNSNYSTHFLFRTESEIT